MALAKPTTPAGTPLLALLHPRAQARPFAGRLALGCALGALGIALLGWPLWVATALTLALLAPTVVQKWRDDAARWGVPAMVLSMLVLLQGFHAVEHITQFVQYHLLQWHPRDSSGLISAANAEIVHFGWNWLVLLAELYLLRRGLRGPWAWLLVAWTAAHTFEHTYLMVQYLDRLQDLAAEGASPAFAQGLPGILGLGGWLQASPATAGTFLCRLPGVTTAIRLDVHFWWNVGEAALMLPAAHVYMRRIAGAHQPLQRK
jgi:hypothetical protein